MRGITIHALFRCEESAEHHIPCHKGIRIMREGICSGRIH